jgi:putative oxidoreductase
MTDQPTSIFPGSGSDIGGTGTQPPDGPRRRELMWNPATDVGLLLLRFAVGGVFLAHGAQKVFGVWGGPGIGGFTEVLRAFGYRNPEILVWVTAMTELIGGAGVVLGLLTPLAASGLLALMINTVLLKAGNGFFIAGPPGAAAVELDVVLGLAAAALVLTGSGRIALDNGRTWQRRPAPWGVLCLAIGVAAGLVAYFLLRPR